MRSSLVLLLGLALAGRVGCGPKQASNTMPVTTTRPLPCPQLKISSTARANGPAIGPSSRLARASSAAASVRTRSDGFNPVFSPALFLFSLLSLIGF